MNKNEMPVVELFENIRDLEAKTLCWNVPIALYAEVENLQSYAEKVTEGMEEALKALDMVIEEREQVMEEKEKVTEENKRLNLLLVAQSKDIVTARKAKEELDRAVEFVKTVAQADPEEKIKYGYGKDAREILQSLKEKVDEE